MHTECVYVSLSVCLTDPLGFEQFEGDCGCSSASALGGDDDLTLVIFSRTHSTHYLTSRHPFSGQQTVMTTDRQTWQTETDEDQEKRKSVKWPNMPQLRSLMASYLECWSNLMWPSRPIKKTTNYYIVDQLCEHRTILCLFLLLNYKKDLCLI